MERRLALLAAAIFACWSAFATELVDDDYSTDTSANYAGRTITVASGNATQTGDGISRHTTATTGNEIWVRWYPTGTAWVQNGGIAVSDASGNGFIVIFETSGANVVLYFLSEYDTHTTYAGNDDALAGSLGSTTAGPIGMTFDLANNVARFWNPVTADEPTAINSWDGVGREVEIAYGTLGQTQDGNYIGLGNWNTGGSTLHSTRLAFGTVGAGGGGGVVDVLTLQDLGKAYGPHRSQQLGGLLQ